MGPGDHAISWLGRLTRPARARTALLEFTVGQSAPLDRLLSRAYFVLAARRWAREQMEDDRLTPLRAGFAAVDLSPRVVIELGCGAGRAAAEAAHTWPECEVRGYDVSGPMIRAARSLDLGPRVTFERRGATAVRGKADLVFMCNFLPNPATVRSLLAPGGKVLVVSSFERRSGEIAAAVWSTYGFDLDGGADVGDGCYEIYALREAS